MYKCFSLVTFEKRFGSLILRQIVYGQKHQLQLKYVGFSERDIKQSINYRPISVIPTVARVFERLIYEQLHSYLDNCNLICTQQPGFRPLPSTVTALIDLTNDWYVNIDRKNVNGVIFLDLKKAFDTVNHEFLLKSWNIWF